MFHHHIFRDNKDKSLYLPRVGPYESNPWIKWADLPDANFSVTQNLTGTRTSPLLYNNLTISHGITVPTFATRIGYIWCNNLIISNFRSFNVTGATGGSCIGDNTVNAPGFGGPGGSGGGAGGGNNGSGGPASTDAGSGGSNGQNGGSTFASGGIGAGQNWASDSYSYGTAGAGGDGGFTGGGIFGPGSGGTGGSLTGGGGGGGEQTATYNGAGGGGSGGRIVLVCRYLTANTNANIRANGGAGGTTIEVKSFYMSDAGAGGGGGGGQIWIAALGYNGGLSALTANGGGGGRSYASGLADGNPGVNGTVNFFEISNNWETLSSQSYLSSWDNR